MTLERLNLAGKTALVVGCGEVGKATALALAEAGADMAVVAATQEANEALAAKRVARQVEAMGRRSLAQAIDAANGTAVQVMVRQVAKDLGGLEILINCQDFYLSKPAERLTDAEWMQVINANLSSVFYACRSAAREMERSGRGKIINVASVVGAIGVAQSAAYCAAKGGVIALTRALCGEFAPKGIWVNCVAAGSIEGAQSSFVEGLEGHTPLGRLGRPEDVAAAVVYLAAPASDYVCGQILFVDGGFHAFKGRLPGR